MKMRRATHIKSEVSKQCFLPEIIRELREDHAEADKNLFK